MTLDNDGAVRRDLLKFGAYTTVGALLVPATVKPAAAAGVFRGAKLNNGAREISFHNTHTGETFSGVYRVGNKYLPEAFDKINYVLRDFRTGDIFPIDPRLIDIIYTVHGMTRSERPYEIISGYRSPKTNAMLRQTGGGGVAKKSLHMSGRAIDVRIPGFSTARIRDIAKSIKAGGVGYYGGSDFVHMDTGSVRSW